MQFLVLGPLEVVDRGRTIEIGRPQQRALLALLILNANSPVSADRLIDELWENEPPPQALTSLQAYVSKLRRVLDGSGSAADGAPSLLFEPAGYVLRVTPASIDAARFESLVAKARADGADGNLGGAVRVYGEALRLWRAEFLADLAHRGFVRDQAVRYSELRLAAMEEWADLSLKLGAHQELIPELEMAVRANPVRETMRALLALALYRAGRQADALQRIAEGRDLLADQLGIDPGATLRDLELRILQQSPDLDVAPASPPGAGARISTTSSPQLPAAAGDFVGRTASLATLRKTIDEVLAGEARVALLVGEAGIGKTRLGAEAAAYAHAAGATVVWGRCHEGIAPALWPWSQILAQLGRSRLDELPDQVRAFIEPSRRDQQRRSRSGAAARAVFYDATMNFILQEARAAPLVIIIDDLQWADVASLQLLEFLVRELLAARRLLLVGAYRPDEVDEGHLLIPTLAVLARAETTQIMLKGLAPSEVAEMIEGVTDRASERSVIERVHERTGGNPFFVRELARLIESEGVDGMADDLLTSAVPLSVRDVIRSRLRRLPNEAVPLLTLCAVEGREFDFDVISKVEGVDGGTLLDVLDSARAADLVQEDDFSQGRLRFAHDLVRESLLDRITNQRKIQLHARLADAYVKHGASDAPHRSLKIASHAWSGATVLGASRAIPLLVAGADAALGLYAYEDATDLLRKALSLLEKQPPSAHRDAEELKLRVRLGNALARYEGYGSEATGTAFERATTLARQIDAPTDAIPALWGTWAYHYVRAEFEDVLRLGNQLISLGEKTGNRDATAVGTEALGIVAVHLGDLHDALNYLRSAVDLADETVPSRPPELLLQDQRISARGFYSVALASAGRVNEAWARTEEMHRLGASDVYSRTLALLWDAWVGVYVGDLTHVEAQAGEVVRCAEEYGLRLWQGFGHVFHGWSIGDSAEIMRGCQMVESTGARYCRFLFHDLLADVESAKGREAQAVQARALATKATEETGERFLPRLGSSDP